MQAIMETAFDIAYLAAIISIGVIMYVKERRIMINRLLSLGRDFVVICVLHPRGSMGGRRTYDRNADDSQNCQLCVACIDGLPGFSQEV